MAVTYGERAQRGKTFSIFLVRAVIAFASVTSVQSSPGGRVDACDFLHPKELAALLGTPVTRGEQREAGEVGADDHFPRGTYSSTCIWRLGAPGTSAAAPRGSIAQGNYVLLLVMQWPKGSRTARRFLDSFIDAAKDGTIDRAPVSLAIGEAGLWWGDGVAFYQGDRSFGISVHLTGERERERGLEESLARSIARRP